MPIFFIYIKGQAQKRIRLTLYTQFQQQKQANGGKVLGDRFQLSREWISKHQICSEMEEATGNFRRGRILSHTVLHQMESQDSGLPRYLSSPIPRFCVLRACSPPSSPFHPLYLICQEQGVKIFDSKRMKCYHSRIPTKPCCGCTFLSKPFTYHGMCAGRVGGWRVIGN